MYLAKRVLKTWEESFIDEDTGETVTIERNEILFDRGTLIDQDTLAKIRFSMEADGIKEVEVSNQNRLAFENENSVLYPYIAQAQIGDKKHKFLLYATGLENTCSILKDYIELNYMFGFTLTMVKEFDSCVILTDNLKERKVDDASLAYLKNEITMAEYVDKMDDETEDSDEESKPNEKKFYQIETKITFTDGENEDERVQTFVVNTFNVDRAMMLITHYLKIKRKNVRNKPKKRGMSSKREKSIQLLNPPNLYRSGGLFRKNFQWLIWNNFVNLPARSVKIGRANMGRLAGVTIVMRSNVEEGSSILPRPS